MQPVNVKKYFPTRKEKIRREHGRMFFVRLFVLSKRENRGFLERMHAVWREDSKPNFGPVLLK